MYFPTCIFKLVLNSLNILNIVIWKLFVIISFSQPLRVCICFLVFLALVVACFPEWLCGWLASWLAIYLYIYFYHELLIFLGILFVG